MNCRTYLWFSGIVITILLILYSDKARERINDKVLKLNLRKQNSKNIILYFNNVYDVFSASYPTATGPLNVHQKCQDMMDNGHWASEDLDHATCKRDDECRRNAWLPNSCTWKLYGRQETDACLRKKNIWIVGDSS